VKFRNSHDLLVYIVSLEDSDRSSVLLTGKGLLDTALADGMVEWNESEFALLAKHLWTLERDNAVAFEDTAWKASQQGRALPLPTRPPYAVPSMNDLTQASGITVTGHGRQTVGASRPTVAINVADLDLTVLLARVEEEVEAMDGPDEAKEEARSKLHAATRALGGVATGAAGEMLTLALRRVLG
jgi:hypothetical protein